MNLLEKVILESPDLREEVCYSHAEELQKEIDKLKFDNEKLESLVSSLRRDLKIAHDNEDKCGQIANTYGFEIVSYKVEHTGLENRTPEKDKLYKKRLCCYDRGMFCDFPKCSAQHETDSDGDWYACDACGALVCREHVRTAKSVKLQSEDTIEFLYRCNYCHHLDRPWTRTCAICYEGVVGNSMNLISDIRLECEHKNVWVCQSHTHANVISEIQKQNDVCHSCAYGSDY
jgi:hypothetical protein